jgi:hypothetical protein
MAIPKSPFYSPLRITDRTLLQRRTLPMKTAGRTKSGPAEAAEPLDRTPR